MLYLPQHVVQRHYTLTQSSETKPTNKQINEHVPYSGEAPTSYVMGTKGSISRVKTAEA